MIVVYGIRNCDTIRKTLHWLHEHDYPHQFHDYRKDGLSEQLMNTLLSHFSVDQLINRRGTTWRKLPEASKQNLTPASAAALMADNPALIRRPLLSDGRNWLAGFDPQQISQTLKP